MAFTRLGTSFKQASRRNVARTVQKTVRGQIALWMMTKFAMVFFIILLAGIMVSFSQTQKTAICRTQAQSMASSIASTVGNVVNSPVEDERKVFSFESSLSVGQTQLERYTVSITNIQNQDNAATGSLVVHVISGTGCEGYARATYDRSMVVVDPVSLTSKWKPGFDLQMKPSDIQDRDYYLIIAKCHPKRTGYSNYLYMKRCHQAIGVGVNPETCDPILESNLKDFTQRLQSNPLLQCCGWEAVQTDPATLVNSVTGGTPKCPA